VLTWWRRREESGENESELGFEVGHDIRFVVSAAQYFFPILRVQALESMAARHPSCAKVWSSIAGRLIPRPCEAIIGVMVTYNIRSPTNELAVGNRLCAYVFVPTLHVAEFVTSFS